MAPEEVDEKMATYDRIFKEAEGFGQLCEVEGESCLAGKFPCCVVQPGSRKPECDMLEPSTGCRIKTLMCKIWFCGAAKKKHPELQEKISGWQAAIADLPGILFFQSRNDYERSLKSK